jgi:hypothetical protein
MFASRWEKWIHPYKRRQIDMIPENRSTNWGGVVADRICPVRAAGKTS